jgi:nicotinamidase-related amidase
LKAKGEQKSRKSKARIAGEPILRVAVAGAGAFGKQPSPRLPRAGTAGLGVALVAAVEPDAARAADAAAKYAIPVFATVDELLAADLKLDAATSPFPPCIITRRLGAARCGTRPAGRKAAGRQPRRGRRSDSRRRGQRASASCSPATWSASIPAVLAVEPQLRRPMFFEAHRLSVFTPRALDVDVVLDLMIHDLDIVLTFAARRCARCAPSACRFSRPRWTSPTCASSSNPAAWPTSPPRASPRNASASCASLSRASTSPSTTRARIVLVIRVEAGAGKASPAELIASLPPQVAAMLPPGIAEGIASGKIDLKKIDPA